MRKILQNPMIPVMKILPMRIQVIADMMIPATIMNDDRFTI